MAPVLTGVAGASLVDAGAAFVIAIAVSYLSGVLGYQVEEALKGNEISMEKAMWRGLEAAVDGAMSFATGALAEIIVKMIGMSLPLSKAKETVLSEIFQSFIDKRIENAMEIIQHILKRIW